MSDIANGDRTPTEPAEANASGGARPRWIPRPGAARTEAIRVQRADLGGVLVVVAARNGRGRVAATLASLKRLAERGARIMHVDLGSSDGSPAAVQASFSFVTSLKVFGDVLPGDEGPGDGTDSAELIGAGTWRRLLGARAADQPPFRYVMTVAAGVEVDRRTAHGLIAALVRGGVGPGEAVFPRMVDGSGDDVHCAPADGSTPRVWMARATDVAAGRCAGYRRVTTAVALETRAAADAR